MMAINAATRQNWTHACQRTVMMLNLCTVGRPESHSKARPCIGTAKGTHALWR